MVHRGRAGRVVRSGPSLGGHWSRGWLEEGFRALWPPIRRTLPWVVLVAAAVVGVWLTAGAVRRSVSRRPRFRIRSADLRIRRTITVGRLRLRVTVWPVGVRGEVSALERGLAERLAWAYRRHPWVERVESLRIAYPNRVLVKLVLRRPVVAVRVGEVYLWADREGVRLPGRWTLREVEEAGLLYVEGVMRPVPDEGRSWPDPGVRAAAAVALALGKAARTFDITAIDVTNIDGRVDRRLSEIVLLTAHHTRILWGRPPGARTPGELAPADKLRLLRLAAAKGMLDGPGEVDVRFPNQAIGRLPLRR